MFYFLVKRGFYFELELSFITLCCHRRYCDLELVCITDLSAENSKTYEELNRLKLQIFSHSTHQTAR